MADLRDQVWPVFNKIFSNREPKELYRFWCGVINKDPFHSESPLVRSLYRWGFKWHLYVPEVDGRARPDDDPWGFNGTAFPKVPFFNWLIPFLIQSLEDWTHVPQGHILRFSRESASRLWAGGEPIPFSADLPGWDYHNETTAQFRKRSQEEFERVRESYISHVEAQVAANRSVAEALYYTTSVCGREVLDVMDVPNKPVRSFAITKQSHFEWLARFQVMEESWANIKDGIYRTKGAVKMGALKAAELIIGPEYGDWVRKGKPGRPPK